MSILEKIAAAAASVLGVLFVVVAVQPASFAIERSTVVAAPADLVYRQIEDLQAMDTWSPWVHMDPQLQVTYEGPEAGVGARSSWRGPEMGEGRLTITAARPPQEVEMRLEMLEPLEATNRVLFTLAPGNGGTRVSWRMEGRNGFIARAIGLFMDTDQMVGGQFERGLASLRDRVEAEARRHPAR